LAMRLISGSLGAAGSLERTIALRFHSGARFGFR
jgi:hypothetical protein